MLVGVLVAGVAVFLAVTEFRAPRKPPPTVPATSTRTTTRTTGAGHHGSPTVASDELARRIAALRRALAMGASSDAIRAELEGIAVLDPAQAIALAHAVGRTPEEQTAWVTALARTWAMRAPLAAWTWLSAQDAARLRELAVGTLPEVVIGAMAESEPALLIRTLDEHVRAPESSLGVSAVHAIHLGLTAMVAHGQLATARDAVENWARDPASPRIGAAAYVTVADGLAHASPTDAAAWLRQLPATEDRDTALVEFPAHWAEQAPQAALAWTEQNLANGLRDRAVERTFFAWVEHSAPEAGEWLAGYLDRAAPGPTSDRLIGAVINLGSAVQSDPALALQWTSLVSDPVKRVNLEDKVILRWARQDRTAAISFIQGNLTLPEPRRRTLVEVMNQSNFLEHEP